MIFDMDCKELTPAAQEIFLKLIHYFPPNTFDKAQWNIAGTVCWSGSWYDLRKQSDRDKLLAEYTQVIGAQTIASAKIEKHETGNITKASFPFILAQIWIEQAVLLSELDIQINTLDLAS